MKLTTLEPQFYKYEMISESWDVVDPAFVWDRERRAYFTSDGDEWCASGRPLVAKVGNRELTVNVDFLREAQGIRFLCPVCFNVGRGGVHFVSIPFADRAVDPDLHGRQWNVTGSGYANLSVIPSYRIIGGCAWHGYITNGEVSVL